MITILISMNLYRVTTLICLANEQLSNWLEDRCGTSVSPVLLALTTQYDDIKVTVM
jgi:hypothetical protein